MDRVLEYFSTHLFNVDGDTFYKFILLRANLLALRKIVSNTLILMNNIFILF